MHKCTKSGLYGAIQAHAAIDQGPIFNSGNINEASLGAQVSFAKMMNKFDGQQAKSKVNIGKHNETGSVKEMLNRGINLGRTPEALLPKKVYSKIDKKMEQWDAIYKKEFAPKLAKIEAKYQKLEEQARKNKAPQERLKALEVKRQNELEPIRKEAGKAYRDGVGKQFKQAREQIQFVYNEHAQNPKRLQAKLKSMGLTQADAYYAEQYLGYLENGGPYFDFRTASGNRSADWISERVSTITGKKVAFNPMTATYNIAELATKAPSVFGFKHTVKGILDAQKTARAEKVSIFDRLPSLEKQGVYSSDLSPLRPEGKHDPLTKTQNLLDNSAYFIGKRGGDIKRGLKEIAYRPKPWNDTFLYQDPRTKTLIPFMSFQFRHFQQYGGWMKSALKGKGMERRQAGRALLVYSLMNGLIFGDKASIPAPIYLIMKTADPEIDTHLKQLSESVPVIGGFLDKGLVGSITGLDLSKYAQPLGGIAVGIGTDMLQTLMELPEKTLPKVGKQLREGRIDKAALLAVNAIVMLSQLHKDGANAAVQKAIDAVVKAYIEDEDLEGTLKLTAKKFFGKESVPTKPKQSDSDQSALPELPQVR
jgi:hypothetical protein